jgi:hypothetical protein
MSPFTISDYDQEANLFVCVCHTQLKQIHTNMQKYQHTNKYKRNQDWQKFQSITITTKRGVSR